MTIHSTHPFADPPERRDPVRRFRGRMPAPVTIWAHGQGGERSGWTVSSLVVADGDPAVVLGLVDEDAAFWDARPESFAISLLPTGRGDLADAFAGLAPAPGGPFTLADWHDSEWGPVLVGAAGWLGVRRPPGTPRHAGWALLVEAVVEHVEVGEGDALTHLRGRYH